MLLLEIGYSEKYDTFTGYVCKDSEYFSYEVNRDTVELSPIRQDFTDPSHFIEEISKRNTSARFLTDPITIRELNYRDLKRYKHLSLATDGNHLSNFKKLLLVAGAVCVAGGLITAGQKYFTQNIQQEIATPFNTTTEPEIIQYYYEIHLSRGGLIDGFDLKQNKEKIFITNRKGLDVTIDISSIQFIEKVAVGNPLSRDVIYGNRQ